VGRGAELGEPRELGPELLEVRGRPFAETGERVLEPVDRASVRVEPQQAGLALERVHAAEERRQAFVRARRVNGGEQLFAVASVSIGTSVESGIRSRPDPIVPLLRTDVERMKIPRRRS